MVTQTNSKLQPAIDTTIRYYALFRYPLLVHEIQKSCQVACSPEDVREYLDEQVLNGNIYCYEGYYCSLPDIETLVHRRIAGNDKAAREIPLALKAGRIIYQFPFVRFVGISGSLSKGFSDKDTDFDFFIVTKKDRLWITRSLLHLFKKLTFVTGHQHRFCMNYFVDEQALQIEEKNIYTATELRTLLPVSGREVYSRLMQANAWVAHFLPNFEREMPGRISDKNNWLKKVASAVLNMPGATMLNQFLMKLTDKKWRVKWRRRGFPEEDYNLAFRTTLHVSKNHPANYQKRILEELKTKKNK